jgi:hypothetical protein
MRQQYTQEVETDNGVFTIKSDNPITPSMIEKTKQMHAKGSKAINAVGSTGTIPKTDFKGQLVDLLTNIQDMGKEQWSNIKGAYKEAAQAGSSKTSPFPYIQTDRKNKTATPISDNVRKIFTRGLTFGTSRFLEEDKGASTDEFYNEHPAISTIADVAGSIPGMGVGSKVVGAAAKHFFPQFLAKAGKVPISAMTKAAGGNALYSGERQAVDSIGQDDDSMLASIAKAMAVGGATGAGTHALGRYIPAKVDRVNPFAAAKKEGIYGNRSKATNASKHQIPFDLIEDTVMKGETLGSNASDPTIKAILKAIGGDSEARSHYITSYKTKHSNVRPTAKAAKSYDIVRGQTLENPSIRTKPVPITKLGGEKLALKQATKEYARATKGGYTPKDLSKLLNMDPFKAIMLITDKMPQGKHDKMSSAAARAIMEYISNHEGETHG